MASITLNGTIVQTAGTLPAIGTQAPDFTVTKTDLGELHLKNLSAKKIILNIFPSLDTPTCARAMFAFNELAKKHPDFLFLCISADLPFAQKRFCSSNQMDNVIAASVFRHPQFGQTYGVEIKTGPLTGLLCRAIVVIDEKGKVTYTQQVKEIANEPDYDAVQMAILRDK